jgi:MEDS: MEthanogen/methylotroph, DcmR Sensory domain
VVPSGLRRDEQLICVADARYPDVERLATELAAAGLHVTQAAEDGQLAVVDTTRFYSLSGYEDLLEQALRQGRRGMRSYGGCTTTPGSRSRPAAAATST